MQPHQGRAHGLGGARRLAADGRVVGVQRTDASGLSHWRHAAGCRLARAAPTLFEAEVMAQVAAAIGKPLGAETQAIMDEAIRLYALGSLLSRPR